MRNHDCIGLVFPNVHDELMFEMTEYRSMGSVPFGARYRLIDFTLSLLVNAGITKVGVLARANYRSLMDHLGTGKPWDLDRKNGGLFILPPFAYGEGTFTGHIDALNNARSFITHSVEKYVALCDCDVLTNFSLDDMMSRHVKSGADITIAYKKGVMPENPHNLMDFTFDDEGRVTDVRIDSKSNDVKDYSLDIIIMERELLLKLIDECTAHSRNSISRDMIQANVDTLNIRGYEVEGYAEIIDGPDAYFKANRDLLTDKAKRDMLFDKERPVLTKTRDDMPTKYGLDSVVKGSLIGDGCIIEGTVKNSVIFRGVTIGKNAVVENSVIMQDSCVESGAEIRNVTLDKNVTINQNVTLCGSPDYPMYIRKGSKV